MLNPSVRYLRVLWNVLLLCNLAWYLRSLAVFRVEDIFTNKRSFWLVVLKPFRKPWFNQFEKNKFNKESSGSIKDTKQIFSGLYYLNIKEVGTFSGNVRNIWIWLASLILILQTAAKFFPWGQQILNFPSLMCILAWSIGKQMECMHWLEDPPCISNFSVPWKTLRQWSDCWTLGERNLGLRPAVVIVLYTYVDHSLVCPPTYQGV